MNIYRICIAKIDSLILKLIAFRMRVALRIEKAKRAKNLPISFPEVEEKKIANIRTSARKQNIDQEFVEKIFRIIIQESVRMQEEQRKNALRK